MHSLQMVLCAVALTLGGCGVSLHRFEYNAIAMASDVRLVLYAEDESSASTAAHAAIARIHELDKALSDYQPRSELSRLAASPPNVPHGISDDLYCVLALSQNMARRSGGAFDITIGPLSWLWREARRTGRIPDERVIAEARKLVGWDKLVLDEHARTAMLTHAGMKLDLGGIGKGFAADEALKVLQAHGIRRCLVGLSGDIAIGQPPLGETGWRIALDQASVGATRMIRLSKAGISTSGDAQQHVTVGAKRHSHIIDATADASIGIVNQQAVTVIAPSAAIADALATTLSILDEAEHRLLLEHYAASKLQLP